MRIFICFGLALFASAASAVQLTWTLDNVVFQSAITGDVGTATGSFDYDADTDTYSNINIVTSGWTDANDVQALEHEFYTDSYSVNYDYPYQKTDIWNYDENVVRLTRYDEGIGELGWMIMDFSDAPLTNAGGISHLRDGLINGDGGVFAWFVTGSVQASVVPIPAAVWLFASALAGLGWFRRS